MVGIRFASALIASGIAVVQCDQRGYSEDTKKYLTVAAMVVAFIVPAFVMCGGTIWVMSFLDKKYGNDLREAWRVAWQPKKRIVVDNSEQERMERIEQRKREAEDEERQQQWEVAQRRMADVDLPKDVIEEQLQWEHERIWNSVNTATRT